MTIRLSKSKLIAFRQCPKRLWLEVHRPDLRTDDSTATRRFAAGHHVGELARTQYADGILIAPDNNLSKALKETQYWLAQPQRRPLFEATFEAVGILIRADLLVPMKAGWHMAEVKSSTQVKPYHLEDMAIPSWVTKQAGLALAKTSVQVIDRQWVYPGSNHYTGLLRNEAVDEQVTAIAPLVPQWLQSAKQIAGGLEPEVKMGKQCNDPFACGFQTYCESLSVRAEFPISWLPNLHYKKREKFEASGFLDMSEVPIEELTPKQQRVRNATLNSEQFFEPLSPSEEKKFAGKRYYLDFETINFAVPIWEGTRPYQQIPFQWSCHIEDPEGTLSQKAFLDLSDSDPSRRFAESLLSVLGKRGPIIVYNQSFEKRIIQELAERYADLAPSLEALLDRVVDLLPVANEHYYHPSMRGSWSIKAVLPAIAPELDYANLEDVTDGGGAQEAYLEAIDSNCAAERQRKLSQSLEAYCGRDTLAMVKVFHFLLAPASSISTTARAP